MRVFEFQSKSVQAEQIRDRIFRLPIDKLLEEIFIRRKIDSHLFVEYLISWNSFCSNVTMY